MTKPSPNTGPPGTGPPGTGPPGTGPAGTALARVADELSAAAGDLLLGAQCPGCTVPGWRLCRTCSAALDSWTPRRIRPEPCPVGFPPTVAAGEYAGLASALITAHKDRQALWLAGVLGRLLALSVAALLAETADRPPSRVVLVPAPSSARANRDRGLDAGRAIARSAARRLGGRGGPPVVVRSWLRQRGGVRDQSGLDSQERAENLAGALRATWSARPRPGDVAIVVDDVLTTGATLTEAARALEAAAIGMLGAATIAATTRRLRAAGAAPARPSGY